MASWLWVNIGSGNGLLQAITWTNVEFSSFKSSDIHIGAVSQEMPQPSITKIRLKLTYVTFYWISDISVFMSDVILILHISLTLKMVHLNRRSFYMEVITHLHPNLNRGLDNLW